MFDDKSKELARICYLFVNDSNHYDAVKNFIVDRGLELLKGKQTDPEYIRGFLKVFDYIDEKATEFERFKRSKD